MARASTTSDVFNAIAEPWRREIVGLLAGGLPGGHDVSEMVVRLGLRQSAVSKHLGVLRKVGVVSVEVAGARRVYRLEAGALRVVGDWVGQFERFWDRELEGIREAAEREVRGEKREVRSTKSGTNSKRQMGK